MKLSLLCTLPLLAATAFAADLPAIPEKPLGVKKELLFEDNFEGRTDLGTWKIAVPTFTVEEGVLKGVQTRVANVPAADGKPAQTPHAAVIGKDLPNKDTIIECRIRFAGNSTLSVEFDDRKFEGAHYGHICKCRVSLKDVAIVDQKDGEMRNDIYALSKDPDPAKKAERSQLLVGKSATFPNPLEAEKWHTLVVETVGDSMRASIDGKPVAFLKSPGIAHATKSKIELGCSGHDGYFDDLKIYNAEPAAP